MRELITLLLLAALGLPTVADAASRKQCRGACEAEINECVSGCGSFGALGNPWRLCRTAVLRRCKQEGLQVCREPLVTACGDTAAPACNGTCSEERVCTQRGPQCECLPQCAGAAAPECNGACPSGEVCVETQVEPFRSCSCVPTCFVSLPPVCGGECPAGESCALFESDGNYFCLCVRDEICPLDVTTTSTTTTTAPRPCSASSFPECGGTCPPGLTCGQEPLGFGCGCQLGGFIVATTTSITTTTTVP